MADRSGAGWNPEFNPPDQVRVRLCVYLLGSNRNGTLYVGVTSHLPQCGCQHKQDLMEGFPKRHGIHTLVWYEAHERMEGAIAREKAIKRQKRAWKIRLIETTNAKRLNLYGELG